MARPSTAAPVPCGSVDHHRWIDERGPTCTYANLSSRSRAINAAASITHSRYHRLSPPAGGGPVCTCTSHPRRRWRRDAAYAPGSIYPGIWPGKASRRIPLHAPLRPCLRETVTKSWLTHPGVPNQQSPRLVSLSPSSQESNHARGRHGTTSTFGDSRCRATVQAATRRAFFGVYRSLVDQHVRWRARRRWSPRFVVRSAAVNVCQLIHPFIQTRQYYTTKSLLLSSSSPTQ